MSNSHLYPIPSDFTSEQIVLDTLAADALEAAETVGAAAAAGATVELTQQQHLDIVGGNIRVPNGWRNDISVATGAFSLKRMPAPRQPHQEFRGPSYHPQ